jgi:DNA-binding MarR family transcriptional regulator
MSADGMADDRFAPLAEAATQGSASTAADNQWAPILPAPHPPPAELRHPLHGTPSKTWYYRNGAGQLLFMVCRFDPPNSKKQFAWCSYGTGGWRWRAPPELRALYGLDRLAARPDAFVLIVEGEKAADAAAELFPGHVVICWPGGSNAVEKADWAPLEGRHVIVWGDADAPGAKAAADVARILSALPMTSVAMVPIPDDWPEGWDLADLGDPKRRQPDGVTLETLRTMLEEAREMLAEAPTPPVHEEEDGEASRQSQREKIVEAVLETGAVFWRDDTGEAFVTMPINGGMQRYRVQGDAFRRMVRLIYGRRFMTETRGSPRIGAASDQAVREAVSVFDAMSLEGEMRTARVRTWLAPGEAVWIDLGDESWRLVRVTADGWAVVEQADVPIIRPAGVKALPLPVRSLTALQDLRKLANVANEADFRLLVSWMVAALYPRGPYAILALDGEQGSGKSTVTRMIRALLDPNFADVQPLPRDERDVVLSCGNALILALDNLSNITPEMADVLCRIATGTGHRTRKLYSNGDEHFTWVQNPVLLNGIPALLSRADLADRAVTMTLPAIPDAERQTEEAIKAAFRQAAPGILAILLDGLSRALRDKGTLRLDGVPRMSDFAHLACAAAPAFGWVPEDVLNALRDNRAAAVEQVIEADAVASAVQALAMDRRSWSGTAAELLQEINSRTPEIRQRERDWPKDATRLSKALRRVTPALRRAGVEVDTGRDATGRWIRIHPTSGMQRQQRHSASAASSRSGASAPGGDAMPPDDASDATAHSAGVTPSVAGWSADL